MLNHRAGPLLKFILKFINFMQVLGISDNLPSLESATISDGSSETQMLDAAYTLAEKLVTGYLPDKGLEFMFKHGRGTAACQLLYPLEERSSDAVPGGENDDANPTTSR